jgi:uncharacterized protein with ParB-like and HNH nuclease domain
MNSENMMYIKQTEDVPTILANLMAAGWNETQIAQLARRRATYSQTSDELNAVVSYSKTEQNRMAFMRWLYSVGRMTS